MVKKPIACGVHRKIGSLVLHSNVRDEQGEVQFDIDDQIMSSHAISAPNAECELYTRERGDVRKNMRLFLRHLIWGNKSCPVSKGELSKGRTSKKRPLVLLCILPLLVATLENIARNN
jgi:hypothetical protein